MKVFDFSDRLFHDIPKQDNPAYGSEECIMITKDSHRQKLFSILQVEPVVDPLEYDSIIKICEVYKLDNAVKIANMFANPT